MKKEMLSVLVLLAVFSFFSLASATFTFNTSSSSFQMSYAGGDSVVGIVNVSIVNEPSTTVLRSNFKGNISLLSLLQQNGLVEGAGYSCTVTNCSDDYSDTQKFTALAFSTDDKKYIGFKINSGEQVSVSSLVLAIASNATAGNARQILLKPLAHDDFPLQTKAYVQGYSGDQVSGCYDRSAALAGNEMTIVDTDPSNLLCENISLRYGPAFKVGARVKNTTTGAQADLRMRIYSQSGDENMLGECLLPRQTQDIQDLSCIINYSSPLSQSYYVCIGVVDDSGSEYSLLSEASAPICGQYRGANTYSGIKDYDLFAQPMQYDRAIINVSEDLFMNQYSQSLARYVQDYIDGVYNGNCSHSCFIPFEVDSDTVQTVSLLQAKMRYADTGGVQSSESVYVLNRRPSLLSTSDYVMLDLAKANFTTPLQTTDAKFVLYAQGKEIWRMANVTVIPGFDFTILPSSVSVAIANEFYIYSSTGNISSSSWKFDTDSLQSVADKRMTHTFYSEGVHTIQVTATNISGAQTTRTFQITVGNGITSANNILALDKTKVAPILQQIKSYPVWVQNEINKQVNLSFTSATLSSIEANLSAADANASVALAELLGLDIPSALFEGKIWQDIPLESGLVNADLGFLEELSGKNIEQNQQTTLLGAISNWSQDHYASKINSRTLYLTSSNGNRTLFTKVDITLQAKGQNIGPAFLIIGFPKSTIVFENPSLAKEVKSAEGVGTYFNISGTTTVSFLVPGEVEPSALNAYLSPVLQSLVELQTPVANETCTGNCTTVKTSKYAFWWYIILAAGLFALYIALQEWYKRHYEGTLFATRDDLFNIISFIFNSRKEHMEDHNIKIKLEDSGWTHEQLVYAFKKIDGKRTGMFEIPVFRFFEKKKVSQEIAKRQLPQGPAGQPSARFIKRP